MLVGGVADVAEWLAGCRCVGWLCWLCWLIVANGSQRTHPGAGAQGKDAGARLDRLGVVGVVDLLAWCAWLLVAVVVGWRLYWL